MGLIHVTIARLAIDTTPGVTQALTHEPSAMEMIFGAYGEDGAGDREPLLTDTPLYEEGLKTSLFKAKKNM